MLVRWGLVKPPVRDPDSESSASTNRAVLLLPFVPVMCTDSYAVCGSPSRLSNRLTRSSVGLVLDFGQRARSSCSTRANERSAAIAGALIGSLGLSVPPTETAGDLERCLPDLL